MISFLAVTLVLALVLFGRGQVRGTRQLEALSRERRKTLGAIIRQLHPAERRALTASSGLAFAADSGVLHLEGRLELIGWRQPMFVLDGLLVAVPEQLLPCALTYNQAQLLLNPHPGLPHAFVLALNGNSLVCECAMRSAEFNPPAAEAWMAHSAAADQFHEAMPRVTPAFLRKAGG